MTLARLPEAKASGKDVFINHERKLKDRRRSDTALVATVNNTNHQSASVFPLVPVAVVNPSVAWSRV